jgi:hypothetical protein
MATHGCQNFHHIYYGRRGMVNLCHIALTLPSAEKYILLNYTRSYSPKMSREMTPLRETHAQKGAFETQTISRC